MACWSLQKLGHNAFLPLCDVDAPGLSVEIIVVFFFFASGKYCARAVWNVLELCKKN